MVHSVLHAGSYAVETGPQTLHMKHAVAQELAAEGDQGRLCYMGARADASAK